MEAPAESHRRRVRPEPYRGFSRLLGKDLCKAGAISLSKGLLGNVKDSTSALEIYSEYFSLFCLIDEDTNISAFDRSKDCKEKVRNSMYNISEPAAEPSFFNFSSHHDVNRLGKMLDLEIVIYRDTRRALTPRPSSFESLEIFHDFRVAGSWRRPRRPVYFVVNGYRQLYKVDQPLDDYFELKSPYFADSEARTRLKLFEDAHIRLGNSPFSSSKLTLKAAAFLLGLPDPTLSPNVVSELFDEEGEAASLTELSSKFQEGEGLCSAAGCVSALGVKLYELWKEKIIFVGFCRSLSSVAAGKSPGKIKNPSKSYFLTVLVVGPAATSMKDFDLFAVTRIVCLYAGDNICLLDRPHVLSVVDHLLQSSDRDKPEGGNYLRLPKRPSRKEAEELRQEKKRKENKKPTRADSKVKICKCSTCSSKTFDENMSKAGPERLCVAPLCVRELLQLLGADSEENLAIIDRMCELSIASMDIESMTLQLDLEPPNSAKKYPYAEIDSAQLGGHFKKVQKPIMISHVDALTFHLPAAERLTLTASSDEESSFYEMIKIYWNKVVALREACRKEKNKISRPIRELIAKYQKAYFEEANKWHREMVPLDPATGQLDPERVDAIKTIEKTHSLPAIARGWWQVLPGQLEAQLNNLENGYQIFSFYG